MSIPEYERRLCQAADRTMKAFPSGVLGFLMLFFCHSVIAAPTGPGLGRTPSAEEIGGDINVFPDGRGLPEGQGTVEEGKVVYKSRCAACHGPSGQGGTAGELAGRSPLNGQHPDQTIGNYWPYATTIFDFIRRSMPLDAPRSLSENEVYAVTAYLLHINSIIPDTLPMNEKSLPLVNMPNRNGFIRMWPENSRP